MIGIQDFNALVTLHCQYNKIEDLDLTNNANRFYFMQTTIDLFLSMIMRQMQH